MKPELLDAGETPDVVDELIAEYLIALDRGQAPARANWLALHPDHAEELARFLDDQQGLSPPALAAQTDETQMSISSKVPKKVTARQSETALWNSVTAPDGKPRTIVEMPFNGSFGDYDLLEMVARGGMGVVFKARHRALDRLVALKMILAGQLADEQHIQRFRAEAQAAARLDHAGIVPVHEVGEQQGLHYFTMAFVEGISLAERLRNGPLPAKEAARLVRDLAAAVAYAHEHCASRSEAGERADRCAGATEADRFRPCQADPTRQ